MPTGNTGTGTQGSTGAGTGNPPPQTPPPAPPQPPPGNSEPTWDAWLASQSDDVKALYEGHTTGLKSALQSERQQREDLQRQLREAAGKLDKNSPEYKSLEELAAKYEATDQRAAFYEDAVTQGVTNLKLAWLAVQSDGLTDKRGSVNFDALKKNYPELFRTQQTVPPPARGNAGNGAGGTGQGGDNGMNELIRRKAGRG